LVNLKFQPFYTKLLFVTKKEHFIQNYGAGEIMQKVLKTLAILATIGILLVVLAGALVTKTGSGEGCGANWPLCHDQLIPDNPTVETVIEYTHRLVTGVVGMLVLAFSLWTAIKYRKIREVVWVAVAALFFILLQSVLGALAVLGIGQASAILALHFGFSLLSFASVLLLCIYVFQLDKQKQLPKSHASVAMKLGVFSLFVYTYIVVYVGAYVRHTGSSLGCPDWPLCHGQFIPELAGHAGIQFAHRVAALILLIGYGFLMYHVVKNYKHDQILYQSTLLILIFTVLQVLSGGAVVLTELHLFPSLLHALFVSFLFGILCHLVLYVFRKQP
jgi:cytochrome c oxidase assembly protein subunit 15